MRQLQLLHAALLLMTSIFLCDHLNWVDESHEFTHFLEQVHYFEDMSKCSENWQGAKGSLARHVAYWEK